MEKPRRKQGEWQKTARTIQIEKGVPPPPTRRMSALYRTFSNMEVNDSFFMPGFAGGLQRLRDSMYKSASRYRNRYDAEFYVNTQIENGGVRVWRVEKPGYFDNYKERARRANEARWRKHKEQQDA